MDNSTPILKVLSETEFKAKCKKLGITYTIKLWNEYMDKVWEIIVAPKTLDKSNHN